MLRRIALHTLRLNGRTSESGEGVLDSFKTSTPHPAMMGMSVRLVKNCRCVRSNGPRSMRGKRPAKTAIRAGQCAMFGTDRITNPPTRKCARHCFKNSDTFGTCSITSARMRTSKGGVAVSPSASKLESTSTPSRSALLLAALSGSTPIADRTSPDNSESNHPSAHPTSRIRERDNSSPGVDRIIRISSWWLEYGLSFL